MPKVTPHLTKCHMNNTVSTEPNPSNEEDPIPIDEDIGNINSENKDNNNNIVRSRVTAMVII
eukprot:11861710-Ditylum_brightwellii.AAC.1